MKAPTSTVGSSPAVTSRWPSSAVVVDLPCVPVTPMPIRPGAAISSPSSACQVTTGMPAAVGGGQLGVVRHGAQRGRDRDPVDAGEVRRIVAGTASGCRPRRAAACTATGASASQPSTTAPARWSRSAAPAAPDPAMPMTWIRSPGRITPATRVDDARGELERRQGRCALVAVAIVRPGVALDDRRPVAERGGHVGQPDRLLRRAAVRARRCRSPPRPAAPPGTDRARRTSSPRPPRPRRRRPALEQLVRHAQQLLLDGIRVRHDAAEEVVARLRDLGDDVPDQPARARLGGGHLPSALRRARGPAAERPSDELLIGGRTRLGGSRSVLIGSS